MRDLRHKEKENPPEMLFRVFCVMIDAHKILYLIVFAAKRMAKGAATLTSFALGWKTNPSFSYFFQKDLAKPQKTVYVIDLPATLVVEGL